MSRTRLLEFIYGAPAENPHLVGKPLIGELSSLRSARRAQYRVIYRIDDEAATVTVVKVAQCGDAYRREQLRRSRSLASQER